MAHLVQILITIRRLSQPAQWLATRTACNRRLVSPRPRSDRRPPAFPQNRRPTQRRVPISGDGLAAWSVPETIAQILQSQFHLFGHPLIRQTAIVPNESCFSHRTFITCTFVIRKKSSLIKLHMWRHFATHFAMSSSQILRLFAQEITTNCGEPTTRLSDVWKTRSIGY